MSVEICENSNNDFTVGRSIRDEATTWVGCREREPSVACDDVITDYKGKGN